MHKIKVKSNLPELKFYDQLSELQELLIQKDIIKIEDEPIKDIDINTDGSITFELEHSADTESNLNTILNEVAKIGTVIPSNTVDISTPGEATSITDKEYKVEESSGKQFGIVYITPEGNKLNTTKLENEVGSFMQQLTAEGAQVILVTEDMLKYNEEASNTDISIDELKLPVGDDAQVVEFATMHGEDSYVLIGQGKSGKPRVIKQLTREQVLNDIYRITSTLVRGRYNPKTETRTEPKLNWVGVIEPSSDRGMSTEQKVNNILADLSSGIYPSKLSSITNQDGTFVPITKKEYFNNNNMKFRNLFFSDDELEESEDLVLEDEVLEDTELSDIDTNEDVTEDLEVLTFADLFEDADDDIEALKAEIEDLKADLAELKGKEYFSGAKNICYVVKRQGRMTIIPSDKFKGSKSEVIFDGAPAQCVRFIEDNEVKKESFSKGSLLFSDEDLEGTNEDKIVELEEEVQDLKEEVEELKSTLELFSRESLLFSEEELEDTKVSTKTESKTEDKDTKDTKVSTETDELEEEDTEVSTETDESDVEDETEVVESDDDITFEEMEDPILLAKKLNAENQDSLESFCKTQNNKYK